MANEVLMAAFLTPQELRAYPLPVTAAQWSKVSDDKIAEVLDMATTHIEDFLDRNIASAYYTERLPGNGRYTLMVDQYPVTALVSVSSRDISENTESFSTSDFLIHGGAGIIEWVDKLRNSFFRSRIWVVQYVAGFSAVPGPIKHATALQAIEMLQPLFRGGTDFVQVDLIEGINEQIVDLLEKYKRKRMG
jgi:hypothetical protein